MKPEVLYTAAALIFGAVVAVLAGLLGQRGKQVQKAENDAADARQEAAHANAENRVAREDDDALTRDLADALDGTVDDGESH